MYEMGEIEVYTFTINLAFSYQLVGNLSKVYHLK